MKSLILSCTLFMMTICLVAQVAIPPALGDGSESNPYQISSLENLYWLAARNDVVPSPSVLERYASHYIQIADIDASPTADWFGGQGWIPIGYFDSEEGVNAFSGSYNGQGLQIDGLWINRPDTDEQALFSYVDGANLSCITLTDVNVSGAYFMATLAVSIVESTVIGCYSTGSLSCTSGGGLMTYVSQNSSVINCYTTVQLDTLRLQWGGGFAIGVENSEVINCHCTSRITGNFQMGGFAVAAIDSYIDNCYSTGDVGSSAYFVDGQWEGPCCMGGLLSFAQNSTIIGSYNTGKVEGLHMIGGLVGQVFDGSEIIDSYNTGAVSARMFVGGLINVYQREDEYNLENCYNTGTVTGIKNVGGLIGEGYYLNINGSYNEGDVFGEENVGGLIGYASECSINNSHNLGDLEGQIYVGGLVGKLELESQIDNCSNLGSLSGEQYLGGLAGYSNGGSIESSFNLGDILGQESGTGGIVGWGRDLSIDQCYNEGSITGSGDGYGGIGGELINCNISNCYNAAPSISGLSQIGGIIGSAESTYVASSYNTSPVTGVAEDVGGIVGSASNTELWQCFNKAAISSSGTNVGGLVGSSVNLGDLYKSYNTGSIQGADCVGGLVGLLNNSNIGSSYNRAIISGSSEVGGLCGLVENQSFVCWSYSTGLVSGETEVGGLVGLSVDSTINLSYWNTESSGQQSSSGGEGRTTQDMTYPYSEDTYENFIYDGVWAHDYDYTINDGYPYLADMPVSNWHQHNPEPQMGTLSNFPNPFNPTTTIHFELIENREMLSLDIYNLRGQKIHRLIERGAYSKGRHSILWDGKDSAGRSVGSGLYLYRLSAPGFSLVNKMILAK